MTLKQLAFSASTLAMLAIGAILYTAPTPTGSVLPEELDWTDAEVRASMDRLIGAAIENAESASAD